MEEEVECRVCRDVGGELLSPCDCAGSMRYIHKECLKQWVLSKVGGDAAAGANFQAGARPDVVRQADGGGGDLLDAVQDLLLARANLEHVARCNVCLAPWRPWKGRRRRRRRVELQNRRGATSEPHGSGIGGGDDSPSGAAEVTAAETEAVEEQERKEEEKEEEEKEEEEEEEGDDNASPEAAGSFGAYCRCMMVTYPFKDGYRELYGRAGDGEGGGEGGGGQIDLTEWDVCSVSRRLACWLQGQHQRLRAFASHVMERQCCEHLGCVLLRLEVWCLCLVICMVLARAMLSAAGGVLALLVAFDQAIDSIILPNGMAVWLQGNFPPLECFQSLNYYAGDGSPSMSFSSVVGGLLFESKAPPSPEPTAGPAGRGVLRALPSFLRRISSNRGGATTAAAGAATAARATAAAAAVTTTSAGGEAAGGNASGGGFVARFALRVVHFPPFFSSSAVPSHPPWEPLARSMAGNDALPLLSIDISIAGVLIMALILRAWVPLRIFPRPLQDLAVLVDILCPSLELGLQLLCSAPVLIYMLRLSFHKIGILDGGAFPLDVASGKGFAFHTILLAVGVTPCALGAQGLVEFMMGFEHWRGTAMLRAFLASLDRATRSHEEDNQHEDDQ